MFIFIIRFRIIFYNKYNGETMGQEEVFNTIKKNPGITARRISERIKVSKSPVLNSLNKLLKYKEIKYKNFKGLCGKGFFHNVRRFWIT